MNLSVAYLVLCVSGLLSLFKGVVGHHLAHDRHFWWINTCGHCVASGQREDSYKACDLFALRLKLSATRGIVHDVMNDVGEDYSIDINSIQPSDVSTYFPLGAMMRAAYSTIQNISLSAQIISNYQHLQLNTRQLSNKLTIVLCDIDRILRSGNFYDNTVFPSCIMADPTFRHGFTAFSRNDMINYLVNFLVHSKYRLDTIIGNINHILVSY